MNKKSSDTAYEIVRNLLENDPFSRWMGIRIEEAGDGYCRISCRVKANMLNGFKIAHGGIIFSLADTALAFAAATSGQPALALDHSVTFTRKAESGEVLTATANKVNLTRKTGLYLAEVRNGTGEIVAVLKGTVYRPSPKNDK